MKLIYTAPTLDEAIRLTRAAIARGVARPVVGKAARETLGRVALAPVRVSLYGGRLCGCGKVNERNER